MVRYFASLPADRQAEMEASFERQLAVGERYGDDAARELADIEAGLYPVGPAAR